MQKLISTQFLIIISVLLTLGNNLNNEKFMLFKKNKGQWDGQILFSISGSVGEISFFNDHIIYNYTLNPNSKQKEKLVIYQTFINANTSAELRGYNKQKTKFNYLIGNNPENHFSDINTYSEILYKDIYKNIDIKYFINNGNIKYDIIVRAGAVIEDIKIAYSGIDALFINQKKQLEIKTAYGTLIEEIPLSYEVNQNNNISREVKYRVYKDNTLGFFVDEKYDRKNDLVIDPVALQWSTYVGATAIDAVGYLFDIAVDIEGNIYGTGRWHNAGLPVSSNAFNTSHSGGTSPDGGMDTYVFKMNADGKTLEYCTYIGGSGDESSTSIAVNDVGEVFLCGFTSSADFPVSSNAYQKALKGSSDIFVLNLNKEGTGLKYSTFVGGTDNDGTQSASSGLYPFSYRNTIAVNQDNEVYVAGYVFSSDFPMVNAFQNTIGGSSDIVVFKLNANGSNLIYSSFLGGNSYDAPFDLKVDKQGKAYITGVTSSPDFITTLNSVDAGFNGATDAFLTVLSTDGSAVEYSSYLGGSSTEYGHALYVDQDNDVYITGNTQSQNFPMPVLAYDTSYNGTKLGGGGWNGDVFVTKISPDGNGIDDIIWSTFIGGPNSETGEDIVVSEQGNIYVTGTVGEDPFDGTAFFPTTADAYQSYYAGGNASQNLEIFISEFNNDGTELIYSSYLGTAEDDYWPRLELFKNISTCEEELLLSATTHSTLFPVLGDIYQGTKSFDNDLDVPVLLRFSTGDSIVCIINDLFIPNVFSPNNDGINDVFTIKGLTGFKSAYLAIYDSWGERVYEEMATQKIVGWNGIYRGKKLNSNVFTYYLEVEYGSETKAIFQKGNLNLIR